jgi:hypothetical protein
MTDHLIVNQGVWLLPVDETLPWRNYDLNDPATFPVDGSQVWVAFENGRSGPANFSATADGHFSCFNAPFGELVNQKPSRWVYKHWNPNVDQPAGAGEKK